MRYHFISCSWYEIADECTHRLKNAGPQKQEAARIEVENAEDDLVQKTEVAITLMKTVLENVRVDTRAFNVPAYARAVSLSL